MKKIPISSQIVILFLIILLLSASAFTVITSFRLHAMAEEETYSRLLAYSTLIENQGPVDPDIGDFKDMKVAFIARYSNNDLLYSNDIGLYLDEDDLATIMKTISDQKEAVICNKLNNYNQETIYYCFSTKDAGRTFLVLVTDSLYVMNMARTNSLQFIIIFFIIIFLSILTIALWSNQFARRLHRIQDHILSLPKSEYQQSYTDDGLDEVGELSRAVEAMRIELKQNEQTKKEMLQNISHDFKTPIAVIKSYAEAQQDGMADEDSSRIIIAQAEILKNKVNRLLQYNSLEYLSKDREFEDVNMKDVIEEVIQGYRFQTDLIIDLDLNEDVYFRGYRENYTTVVDNIVDNARRYAKTKIKIVLKKDRLRIYNDGEPMDESFLKSGFKPYEKGSKGQFGLGMSIVKRTVEFFGMDLIVKNEAIGVSFIITKSKHK